MAQRNRLTHLVPALLTVIGSLPALDGIAPVITVPDLITIGQDIRAGVTNPVAALNLTYWAQDIYVRRPAAFVNSTYVPAGWVSLDQSTGGLPTTFNAGVAIVGQTGSGTWQYGSGSPKVWTDFSGTSETTAFLLPLRDQYGYDVALRFIPDVAANPGPATVIMRAWDGSSGTTFQSTTTANAVVGAAAANGGSPTAFSAETRTVQTTILASGPNTPPVISGIPTSISLASGESSSFYATSTDSDGDIAIWSAAFQSYSAAASVVVSDFGDGSAYITVTANNPITSSTTTPEILEITATDGKAPTFGTTTVNLASLPPVLVNPPPLVTVATGGSTTVTLTGDDPDGDATMLTWSIGSTGYLYSVTNPSAFPSATFTFTVVANQGTGSGSIPVTVTDENSVSATFYIPINVIVANQPPVIDSQFSSVAVVGQPWETILAVSDPDGDTNLSLTATEEESSSLPTGFSLTKVSGQPTWRLRGIPSSAGTIYFAVTPADGISSPSTYSYTLTVGDPPVVTSSLGTLPVSTPGNPVYAAIAPGSAPGFTSLLSVLQPYGPDIARGWWYSGGFRDIEEQAPGSDSLGLDLKPRTGVFLASTVALGSVDFSTKPFPMPFRITLRPNAWTFFGVPPLWDGTTTSSTHAWSAFRLDRANGTTVNDQDEIIDVLGGTLAQSVREPYGYDPASGYAQVSAMSTGAGYWVFNFSALTYQLVRVGSSDTSERVSNATRVSQGVLRVASTSTNSSNNTPPAPPSGSATSAKAEPGGGSCGAGGLGGLLLAGLVLIGLRRRN